MTRRSFLTNLAGALAVLALPVTVKAACRQRIQFTTDGQPPFHRGPLYRARFTLDPNPPRFNWDGEKLVRVEVDHPNGFPNQAYLDAAYDKLRLTALPRIFPHG